MLTNNMHTYNPPARRGVTLLVVLALMVMFAMLVTAYMVIVTQMRRTVESTARVRIDPPDTIYGSPAFLPNAGVLDEAVQKLLTGDDLKSVIGPHSILENLYGHTTKNVNLLHPPNSTQNLFTASASDGRLHLTIPQNLFWSDGLIGHVVTVQRDDESKPLHNKSTIVAGTAFHDDNTLASIDLTPFENTGLDLNAQVNALNESDCKLLFNAPAHAGPNPDWFNAKDTADKPLPLRPNLLAPDTNGTKPTIPATALTNPDYTAPDFMTMFLAWNDIQDNKLTGIIPSFHRPQLIRYWQNASTYTNSTDYWTELRKYVLRPLPADHPDFTGSNPAAINRNISNLTEREAFQKFLTEGPWDVDNDNDGFYDGIWLDIGLPAAEDKRTQSWYKPLVSYYVVDMDSRINVNTIGQNALNEMSTTTQKEINANGSLAVKGTGLGPAELTTTLVPPSLIQARYGTTSPPGNIASPPGNIAAYNVQGGLVADWYAFSEILFDPLGNRVVKTPTTPPNPADNPYNFDPYNTPYKAEQLEALLRSVIDLDYNALPPELRETLGSTFNSATPKLIEPKLRYNITTQSTAIPASAGVLNGNQSLYALVQSLCPSGANQLWMLLPEEVRRGEKVNLNRLPQQPNWNSTTPLTAVQHIELLKAKVRFAQEIFYLLSILVPEDVRNNAVSRERLAQWSVNLVDFIDPDDVMTPFIYKKTENGTITFFDNADLIKQTIAGTLDASTALTDYALIWGFEKPEVALTETLAFHDRKVADRDIDNYTQTPSTDPITGDSITPDNDFDQVERPQGSLFVELYRQGNPNRTYPENCVVEPGGTLNLAKKTSTDSDYVWRIAIGQAAKSQSQFNWAEGNTDWNALYQMMIPSGGETKYPQFNQWTKSDTAEYHPDLGTPDRFIWFGDSPPAERFTDPAESILPRSFYNTTNANVVLKNGADTLVIAPREITTLTDSATQMISLDAGAVPKLMIAAIPDVTNFNGPNGQVQLNVSEPLPRYSGTVLNDGYDWTGTMSDEPFDKDELASLGTIPCYKTIALQRLTDPNRPHHTICNPYITVDWNMIDLQVFTTEKKGTDTTESAAEESSNFHNDKDNFSFSSREWKSKTAAFCNHWDRVLDGIVNASGTAETGKAGLTSTPYDNDGGAILTAPIHSLGRLHDEVANLPQLHFPWHDAPLMNSGELMLVPATAPGRFGMEFHDNDSPANFFGLKDSVLNEGSATPDENQRFGYRYQNYAFAPYLNWGDFPATAQSEPYMQKLFDFVHVPSKFAHPPMREPGKINLNTLTEEGWKTLAQDRNGFPSYADFRTARQWPGDKNDYPSEFKPFRSPSGTHFVPPLEGSDPQRMYDTATSATLLGLEGTGGKTALVAEDAANPYTALQNVMRLSDVTTTRSNVFAVWITVGYFKVEKFENPTDLKSAYSIPASASQISAIYPDLCVLGEEMGHANGTVKRHRAFYLIDRSIPAGFRRGDKLNSQEVILKKTLLD